MVIELTLTFLLVVLLTCYVNGDSTHTHNLTHCFADMFVMLMVIQLTLTILLIVLLTCYVNGDSTHTHNLTHCFADMLC
jgi:uncharacterized membrane protein YhdT